MSSYRFRERWSLPSRRARPADVGERMAAWMLDAVHVLGADLSWRTVGDESRDEDTLVRRRVVLEGRRDGRLVARAASELALSRGARPSGSGRIEVVRAAPWTMVSVDTHGGEDHWDLDAFGVTDAAFDALRIAHRRALAAVASVGGSRRDPPETIPVGVAKGAASDLAQWLEDLGALGAEASVSEGELRLASLSPADLAAAFEARVTLGEILAEAGVEDWDTRALELLFAATRAESAL